MNNFLKKKNILIIFCIVLSNIAYSQTNDDTLELAEFVNRQTARDDDTLTALPFDLVDFVNWQSARDREEDYDIERYKDHFLSENESLMRLIGKINEHAIQYLILKSDKTDCTMYLTISQRPLREYLSGLYYDLTNVIEDRIVGYLPLGALLENKRKRFIISDDLEITLYDEKIVYSKKKEGVVVVKQEMTGKYRIQKDGSIMRIK